MDTPAVIVIVICLQDVVKEILYVRSLYLHGINPNIIRKTVLSIELSLSIYMLPVGSEGWRRVT